VAKKKRDIERLAAAHGKVNPEEEKRALAEEAKRKQEERVLQQIFDEMDSDESAFIGLDELYGWINGRLARALRSRDLTLGSRRPKADPSLVDLDWGDETSVETGVHTLRRE